MAESNSDNVKLSDEHAEFLWLPFDKALERATFKSAKDVLKNAAAYLEKMKIY